MARHTASVCRLCRREGLKLFLKGDRCFSEKCAVERRAYPPGQHGQRRSKQTPYGQQLREKQKMKRIYGLMERQFRITFERAEQMAGITGSNLLQLLERRLDNVVYRAGFARSRQEARLLVLHGHVAVNNKRVNIPSYVVREQDAVGIHEKSRSLAKVAESLEGVDRRGGVPDWLALDKGNLLSTVAALPTREHLASMPVQEQFVVELYSK